MNDFGPLILNGVVYIINYIMYNYLANQTSDTFGNNLISPWSIIKL